MVDALRVKIINNTIYQPAGDAVRLLAGSPNVRLRDNILWVQAGYDLVVPADSEVGFASDYNNLVATGSGKLVRWVATMCGWTLAIVRQTGQGFQVLPKRWIVERTFGWLVKWRRLRTDYEVLPETSEALIYAALSFRMVRHLAHRRRPGQHAALAVPRPQLPAARAA